MIQAMDNNHCIREQTASRVRGVSGQSGQRECLDLIVMASLVKVPCEVGPEQKMEPDLLRS